jgi:hypothetical protein
MHFPLVLAFFSAISRYQAGQMAAGMIARNQATRTNGGCHTAGINNDSLLLFGVTGACCQCAPFTQGGPSFRSHAEELC